MDNVYILGPDGELYHHGIKGMKWGFRRYQNPDGSLTTAGKKRYADEVKKTRERAQTIKNKEQVKARFDRLKARNAALDERERALNAEAIAKKEAKTAAKEARKAAKAGQDAAEASKKKALKDMTDDEIREAIVRKRLENEYNAMHPKEIGRGKQIANKFINEAVIPAAISSGKKALETAMDKMAKKVLGDKIDPNSIEGLTIARDKAKLRKEIRDFNKNDDDDPDGIKALTKEHTIAKLKSEINEFINGKPEKPMTIEEQSKLQTIQKNQRDIESGLDELTRVRSAAEKKYGTNDSRVEAEMQEAAKRLGLDFKTKTPDNKPNGDLADTTNSGNKNKGIKTGKTDDDTESTTSTKTTSNSSNKTETDNTPVTKSPTSTNSSTNKTPTWAQAAFGKNYEKRVDKILEQMDLTGWDLYYAQQQKSGTSKVTVKTKEQKDYERRVDRALDKIDADGWDYYMSLARDDD